MVVGVESGPKAVTGAVLAGGRGRRMGSVSKPAMRLGGRPLIEYPLAALGKVCDPVVVITKRDVALPALPPGVARWREPDKPRHPLTGLVHALERASGPVLVCAADMPFVSVAALENLLEGLGQAGAVVAEAQRRLQPLLALYAPEALGVLRSAEPGASLTSTVLALDPLIVVVPERDATSVDTPEALQRAEASLSV